MPSPPAHLFPRSLLGTKENGSLARIGFLKKTVQGDQIYMVLCCKKVACPVYVFTVAYTGQVTFYEVTEKHSHVYLVRLYIFLKYQFKPVHTRGSFQLLCLFGHQGTRKKVFYFKWTVQ